MGIHTSAWSIHCYPPGHSDLNFLLRDGRVITRIELPAGMMRDLEDGDYSLIILKGSGFLYWGSESVEYKSEDVLEVIAGIEHRLVAHRNTRVLLCKTSSPA